MNIFLPENPCPMAGPSPRVSVLMTTYNGAAFIRQSIDSVLGQTFEDFELIVVDDCSTDSTAEILAAYDDPRLHVIRNPATLGVVPARNVGFAAARGSYVATQDHDDVSYPRRLAEQVAFLDRSKNVVLVAANVIINYNGRLRRDERCGGATTPELLNWTLHLGNPFTYSSIMFRAIAVRQLSSFMRQQYELADDFDLYHRLLRMGELAIISEHLVIYRQHNQMLSRIRRDEMMAKTVAILSTAYADLLGHDYERAATIIVRHLAAREPVREGATLQHLASILERLVVAYVAKYDLNSVQQQRVIKHAAGLWWDVVLTSVRSGVMFDVRRCRTAFKWAREIMPEKRRIAISVVSGIVPAKRLVKQFLGRWGAIDKGKPPTLREQGFELKGVRFETLAFASSGPPCLYVVVDTEAEFDWNAPLDRKLTSVRSAAAQEKAQTIFDSYGVRPIYVLDYAVASQAKGYEPLRKLLARHACAIGAHLHPWINPPFTEPLSEYNSYAGNLPPKLEAEKLRSLVGAIQQGLGVVPLFFKAGRYGIGPSTLQTLADLGFVVDFSMLPGADLRSSGGADFRTIDARPYRAIGPDILTIPMTRGKIGMMAWLPNSMNGLFESSISRKLRIPGILARAGMVNVVTLTPEGVTAEEQIGLIRTLVNRGCTVFALHYHSPSLIPGNTPYVRTEADLSEFLGRLEKVCRFFFNELGGMPGNPADLLPSRMRNRIWPDARAGGRC